MTKPTRFSENVIMMAVGADNVPSSVLREMLAQVIIDRDKLARENAEFRARMDDLRVIGVFMAGDAPPFISAVFGQISGHYFDAIEAELKNQDVKVEGDALVYVEYKVESDREDFWLKELSRQVEDAPIETPEDS